MSALSFKLYKVYAEQALARVGATSRVRGIYKVPVTGISLAAAYHVFADLPPLLCISPAVFFLCPCIDWDVDQ